MGDRPVAGGRWRGVIDHQGGGYQCGGEAGNHSTRGGTATEGRDRERQQFRFEDDETSRRDEDDDHGETRQYRESASALHQHYVHDTSS